MRNSQLDAIQRSDLIVIGDILSGEKARQGAVIDCHATIRANRVLKGDEAVNEQQIRVHWQYWSSANQSGPFIPTISPIHAIWFLKRRKSRDAYEAMWAEVFQQPMGGYLVPIPHGKPRGPLAYAPRADYQRKLAGELAWAMQMIAKAAGSRLNAVNRAVNSSESASSFGLRLRTGHTVANEWSVSGRKGANSQQTPILEQFESLADLFDELDPAQIQQVSQYLLQRPELHLKALGLLGELRAKNPGAILLMESIYPQLNVTWEAFDLAVAETAIDIRGNEAAIQAVGRMCLSEPQIPAFDDSAARQLAGTKSRTAVPYLETMLGHPELRVRRTATEGICTAFASDADLRPLADESLIHDCRLGTVVANRIGNHGPNIGTQQEPDVKALRAWLATHSAEVSKQTGIRAPAAPSWFTKTASVQ
jgi:hypothetical protein